MTKSKADRREKEARSDTRSTKERSPVGRNETAPKHFLHTRLPQAHSDIQVIGGVRKRSAFHPCIFIVISIMLYTEISQEGEGESGSGLWSES